MAELIDDGWCFACGKHNPHGLHLTFQPTENGARTTFIAERWHQGYQGMAHGGVVFTLLDETVAYAVVYRYGPAATGDFQARIRRPCPLGVPLEVEAWVVHQRQRMVECQAKITEPGGKVVAEATARFMLNGAPPSAVVPRVDGDAII